MKIMTFFEKEFYNDIKYFNIRLKYLLKKYLKSSSENFKQVLNYALFPGGKRIRPIIMFAIGKMFGLIKDDLIIPAAAIELIHNYSLIHDDLPAMDNDDYRRGKLTVHKKYGEATAILAGDALLTLAFEILANQNNIPKNKIVSIIKLVSNYVGGTGLVLGQVLDINNTKLQNSTIPQFRNCEIVELQNLLNKIHINKTAKLIELCVVIPGIIKKLNNNKLKVLHKIGRNIGLLFQITDDLIDFSLHQDKDKLTYPNFYGVEKTKKVIYKLSYETKSLITKYFGNLKSKYLLNILKLISERKN